MLERQEERIKNRMLFWAVLSLIFVMPVAWRTNFATTFGTLFGYLVIVNIIIRGLSGKQLKLPWSTISLFGVEFLWIVISIFDSIRFYSQYGTLSGENAFTAPLGSIYFHLFSSALFAGYICLVQGRAGVVQTIKKAMNLIIWIQIVVGMIQLMIVLNIPGISNVYDGFNFLGILPTASFIRGMSRITMTGSEPASMGASLGILSFPFLLAVLQGTESAKERNSCRIKLLLLAILSYFSKSTTVFIILAAFVVSVVLLAAKAGKISKRKTVLWIAIIMVALLVLLLISITGSFRLDNKVFDEIQYYLIVKPTDTANMSTMHRLSPTINDIEIIKKHPLLGVGDGNQGFTYKQNVPSYMLINPKSQNFANGIGGVVNGGAWFWAVLSGYGIVGIIAILIWYNNHYRMRVKKLRESNAFLYRFYIYALPAIIITLLSGAMEAKIVFILSIPLWNQITEEEYNK